MADQVQENVNWNMETLVLQTIGNMSRARAKKEYDAYFDYFEDAFQMTMNYLPVDSQIDLENDVRSLYATLQKVEEEVKHEAERMKAIQKLKMLFANTHKFYIFKALARMGIQKPEIEGEVDFNEVDFDDFKNIIRTNSGMKTAIEEVKPNATDTNDSRS